MARPAPAATGLTCAGATLTVAAAGEALATGAALRVSCAIWGACRGQARGTGSDIMPPGVSPESGQATVALGPGAGMGV